MIKVDCPNWKPLGKISGICAISKPRRKDGTPVARPSHAVCARTCGVKLIEITVGGKSTAVPRERWPAWANELAALAVPADAGLGDVIARTLGKSGEVFKDAFKRLTGSDCGCSGRQQKLNGLYPLKSQIGN